MASQWSHLKESALRLRKRGSSIREIETALGVAKSTLSHWFRNVKISPYYQNRLRRKSEQNLHSARLLAAKRHTALKHERIDSAKGYAKSRVIALSDNKLALEIALAMLYLGEGSKKEKGLVLGNSNAMILNFFLSALCKLYPISKSKLRCELHLRYDQNVDAETSHWSFALGIDKSLFRRAYKDPRTSGRATYAGYHGVCVISYGDVAIQRRLMYLYELYCQKVIQDKRG